MLRPGGVFTQYSYVHARFVVYSPQQRAVSRWYADPWLRKRFAHVDREAVLLNAPPAIVYTCRG